MKYLFHFISFFSFSIFAQEPIETKFITKTNLNVEELISVTNFNSIYYIENNIFYKKSNNKPTSYNNLQLGNINSANTFNTLKPNLFYKDFNTVIILDNRLSEIFKINFNTLMEYKNVSHVSTGHDNTIWVFNQDTRKLELFDYMTETTRSRTAPVQSKVLDLNSNYNFSWLLTEKYLYTYNYFGSLVKKTKNEGFKKLTESNGNIYLKKGNQLYYLKKNTNQITPIKTPFFLINQFFVTNETLYIYNGKTLQEHQLKID